MDSPQNSGEGMNLSSSRHILSMVEDIIRPQLTYHECQEVDSHFQTNYCKNFLKYFDRMSPELATILLKLSDESKALSIGIGTLLSATSIPVETVEKEGIPDLIKEIYGPYYLLFSGDVYKMGKDTTLIRSEVSTIVQNHLVDREGHVNFIHSGFAPDPLHPVTLESVEVPYPVRSILLSSHRVQRQRLPRYLGKDGQFGPITVPGAIKVLFDESSRIFAFLKEDKSVVFYLYWDFIRSADPSTLQPTAIDSVKDIADLSFIQGHLVGLTSDGKIVQWNDNNFVRERYRTPSRVGKIIRIGNDLVLDQYGTLYFISGIDHIWLIVTHDFEISNITNEILSNPRYLSAAGKKFAVTVRYLLQNKEEVENFQVITTDLYGNRLVQYRYLGKNKKGWIGPEETNYDLINANGRTRIQNYRRSRNDLRERLENAAVKGVLYDPGVYDPTNPELTQVYYVPLSSRTVEIVEAQIHNGQIVPSD